MDKLHVSPSEKRVSCDISTEFTLVLMLFKQVFDYVSLIPSPAYSCLPVFIFAYHYTAMVVTYSHHLPAPKPD